MDQAAAGADDAGGAAAAAVDDDEIDGEDNGDWLNVVGAILCTVEEVAEIKLDCLGWEASQGEWTTGLKLTEKLC